MLPLVPVTVTVTLPVVVKVHDNVEVPEPPVTVDGPRVHAPLSETRETSPLKPFNGETVIVEVAGTPTVADTLVGLAAIEKSGGAVTVTLTVVAAPEAVAPTGLPVTMKVYGPTATEVATLISKSLVPVGVIGLTVKLPQVIPEGRPEQDRVTA